MKRGLLRFHSARPSLYGLEMHLATMFKEIATFKPQVVIIDPITSLMGSGTDSEGKGMVTRLIDYLKAGQVTSLFTSLTQGGHALQQSEAAMSSLMDSWLLLQDYEGNGERNRVLYVLKARGMAHSNQIREFLISDRGVDLVDAYIGPSGVLTGSARAAQGALEKAAGLSSQQEAARRKRELERKREAIERQISGLRSDYESETMELRRIDEQVGTSTLLLTSERTASGILRQADAKARSIPAAACPKWKEKMTKTETASRRSSAPPRRPDKLWQLRLYVSGQTALSRTALSNLKKVCESQLKGLYHIKVIDLVEQPQLAKSDQILAIPTVVRSCPSPREPSLATFPIPIDARRLGFAPAE